MITMQQRKERIEDLLDERLGMIENGEVNTCLLYTSDAADE